MDVPNEVHRLLFLLNLEPFEGFFPEYQLIPLNVGIEVDRMIVRLWDLIMFFQFHCPTFPPILSMSYIFFQMFLSDFLGDDAEKPACPSQRHYKTVFENIYNHESRSLLLDSISNDD